MAVSLTSTVGFFSFRDRRSVSDHERHVLDLQRDIGRLTEQLLDFPAVEMSPGQRFLRRHESRALPHSYRTGFAFFGMILMLSLTGVWGLNAHVASQDQRDLLTANLLLDLKGWSRAPGAVEAYAEDVPDSLAYDPVPQLLQQDHEAHYATLQEWRTATRLGWEHYEQFLTLLKSSDSSLPDRFEELKRQAQMVLKWWTPLLQQSSAIALLDLSDEQYAEAVGLLEDLESRVGFVEFFASGSTALSQILGVDQPQRIAFLQWSNDRLSGVGGQLSMGIELLMVNGSVMQWKPFHVRDIPGLSESVRSIDGASSGEAFLKHWNAHAESSLDLVVFASSNSAQSLLESLAGQTFVFSENIAYSENFSSEWNTSVINDDRDRLSSQNERLLSASQQLFKHPELFPELWPVFQKLVDEKDLFLQSSDPRIQQQLRLAGLDGGLPALEDREDAVMVSMMTSGGSILESDLQNQFQMHVSIDDNGEIKHWLHLQREALNASDEEAFNESIVQVLVPSGSTLEQVDGIDRSQVISRELEDFAVWSFPLRVDASTPRYVALTYTAPWDFDTSIVDNYRLKWLKQAGAAPAKLQTRISIPEELTVFQELPGMPINELKKDEIFAVVAGKSPVLDL